MLAARALLSEDAAGLEDTGMPEPGRHGVYTPAETKLLLEAFRIARAGLATTSLADADDDVETGRSLALTVLGTFRSQTAPPLLDAAQLGAISLALFVGERGSKTVLLFRPRVALLAS